MRQARSAFAVAAVIVGLGMLAGAGAEAAHLKENPKKHKIVYHFNGADGGDHVKKAKDVLGNIMNHVKGVGGWDNIESLVLVTHGDGILPFVEKTMDPEVRKRYDILTTSGMKFGV